MPKLDESSNPCIEIPPEFLQLLDESNQVILSKMWHLPDVSKINKLQFIDTFMTTQPDQVQKSYRKWRFEFDRDTIPKFVNKQTPKMQAVLKWILSQHPSLDEFYEYLLELRKSLKEYDEFLKWASAEHLELPDADEVALNDSNKFLEIQLALQSRQHQIIQQYIKEVEPNLRSQLSAITMNSSLNQNSKESMLYFYDFVKQSVCSFNSITYQIDDVGKFSFNIAYPNNVTYVNAQKKMFGFDQSSEKLEMFDVRNSSITCKSNIPSCNGGGILIYFKNDLLYLDSSRKNKILQNCEGGWKDFVALPTGTNILYGRSIICMDKLYVIDTWNSTNKIYQYDESASQWKEVGKIDCKRHRAGVACINDKIYITGGYDNNTSLKSCIVFKPNANQSNEEIIQIVDMNYPRWFHSLLPANEKFYTIGGYSDISRKEKVAFIEEYDLNQNKWITVSKYY